MNYINYKLMNYINYKLYKLYFSNCINTYCINIIVLI